MTSYSSATAWHSIRLALHLLVTFLLALAAFRAAQADSGSRAAPLAAVAVMAAVYVAGLLPAVRRDRSLALGWLAALVVSWVVLLALIPEGIWLAFPLFFLTAHLVAERLAALCVLLLTVIAVVGFAWHRQEVDAGVVIGPTLGALVALATVLGLRAVDRESARRGVLEERERLAREIHDTLTQGLSSIHLLLGAAQGTLATEPAAAAAHVDRAREVARENLEEARRFVRALSPADLADASLPAALRRLVEKTDQVDRTVTFTLSGEPSEVPTAYDVALLRIAQSGLANAVAHSGADRVAVTLSYLGPEIALDIVDDGRGFDPATLNGPRDAQGFGLVAMRSRTEQLGGRMTIESAPGEGTAIAVTFPLGGTA